MQSTARWQIRFCGKVQFVGFRHTALYLARRLSLTGWVRNLPDGSVLTEVQGATACLRKFLIQLKSQPHIHIENAAIEELPIRPGESGFHVLSD